MYIAYSITSTVLNAKALKRIHLIKREEGYDYDKSDFTFDDTRSLAKVVVYCFGAGFLGGIVGIAGGVILGPMFLAMGMPPVVVGATNQYLALISSISVTTQFVFIGKLNLPYAIALALPTIFSSYIGLT